MPALRALFHRPSIFLIAIAAIAGGVIEEKIARESLDIRPRLAIRRAHRISRADRQLEEIEQNFQKQMEIHEQRVRMKVGVIEASLLMTGTLLWGFGDLIK